MSQTKENRVCVIGLGYVGLTLATVMAEAGFEVIGVEKRPHIVELTNKAQPHFTEPGLADAMKRAIASGSLRASTSVDNSQPCGTYIITVGTPLNSHGKPRLDMVEAATHEVANAMPENALVIVRSTVQIGTTRGVVMPILQASGKSFHIAMCPERTLEGKALLELRKLPQIIGADTQPVRDQAGALFRRLTNSIVQVSSLEAAEILKLVDNTYRDVQFAFANEVARLCEAFDVNASEVIASGKLGYDRTNVPLPGLVGGPCLEKDPHIFAHSAQSRGISLEMTQASRIINERQPQETVAFITKLMRTRAIAPGAKIALLGMAFKGVPATDDLRGSMSIKVLDELAQAQPGMDIHAFDPVIDADTLSQQVCGITACQDLQTAVRGASVVIIANNHPALGEHPPATLLAMMQPGGFIYDYWNHFSDLSAGGWIKDYFAVGNVSRRTS
ncbi:nucleotide sugar dehydrogenase [Orrella daihaiensis]|uniref:Nucleotide sugar dehydrogenase n=1 Tax=Orrella daihaiensis TaxID=2782176 RepID=A0ABY4ALM3_9BURK|nr:nucleotide sugar dehydrogenase [Orrella daihaiensis]UOD51167.1 nucleotide sugar dehydrogenase [Orrella daihaiensis]